MTMTAALCLAMAQIAVEGPRAEHDLAFDAPIATWDEALPLGNGLLGALVWGDGRPLKISLDRTDLWDLRPVPEYESEEYRYTTMREWEKAGRYEDLIRVYDQPYHRPAPTKIPAGRIEIDLPEAAAFASTGLRLNDGTATVEFAGGGRAEVFVAAEETVGLIRIAGIDGVALRLAAPAFGGVEADDEAAISMGKLGELGYPPPKESAGDTWAAYEQEGWGGFRFAVAAGWQEADGVWIGAWTVATIEEGGDPLAIARARVDAALAASFDAMHAEHAAWWKGYWDKGRIAVPNDTIERQWYRDMYKFGSASRRGHPPITLQGPWTADDGNLPPWKGDYHHDLNTELSYWPAYAGNRLDEGLAFLDWLWETRGNNEAWTRRFFEMPGINVPMTADLNNNQIGGWRQYTHSSTTAAWLCHHFYLHWRYSKDETFLRERAYPYLRSAALFLEAVTNERDEAGQRTLPLSSSPEINDNKPEAWFPSITNYDCALIRWLFQATAELAEACGEAEDAARWRKALDEMPELAVGADGALLVAEGFPLPESHRHFSHALAVHPLGTVDIGGGAEEARIVRATLADLEAKGTRLWTGYSFAWFGNLWARAYEGEKAEAALELFSRAFCLPNSFHCNGDQTGEGHSNFTYRPFTLEGNFAAAAGVHEMLLQSHRGVIELFPAVSASWIDVSFERLRAEGAFVVSAERRGGVLTALTIHSEKGGALRVREGASGATYTLTTIPGQTVTLAELMASQN